MSKTCTRYAVATPGRLALASLPSSMPRPISPLPSLIGLFWLATTSFSGLFPNPRVLKGQARVSVGRPQPLIKLFTGRDSYAGVGATGTPQAVCFSSEKQTWYNCVEGFRPVPCQFRTCRRHQLAPGSRDFQHGRLIRHGARISCPRIHHHTGFLNLAKKSLLDQKRKVELNLA